MIANAHQYQITRDRVRRFEDALASLDADTPSDLHPLIAQAQRDGMAGQLAELQEEMAEFDRRQVAGTIHAPAIVKLLSGFRFRLDSEKLLQGQVIDALIGAGLSVQREHKLGPGDVIDALVGAVGIEMKIKGQRRAIHRQCERYCRHDAIAALILMTSAAMGMPATLNGKPVLVVALGRAWL